ncbi:MAG: hypothetical protein ACTHN7_08165 [Solirubrobacterales bacterium]
MSSLKVEIKAKDAERAGELLSAAQGAAGIDPAVLELGPQDSYHLSYASYPMAGSTPWVSKKAKAPVLPYGSPPAAAAPALRIWQLPDSLVNLPRAAEASPGPPLPCCEVGIASVSEASGATQTEAAPCYGWATQVGLSIKKLAAGSSHPTASTTYELIGANQYDVVLLERMLTAAGLQLPDFSLAQMILLHGTTAGPSGQADDGDGVTAFIAQSNLSTVTNPPNAARELEATPAEKTQAPIDFVRLLWECSITRSGGFYLYYSGPEGGKGLPDAIFNDKGEAALTLLLLHGAPAEPARRNRVANYMNAVVTSGYIDASATVYAEARPLPAFAKPSGGDSLKSLGATYRMSAAELAAANETVPLQAAVTVNGGSYTVTAGPPGPGREPQKLAQWLGTTVAELESRNPGVDFTTSLPAQSTLVLPDGLRVAPGAEGRASLAAIASCYDVSLEALARDNAEVAGVFAGGEIAVAELVTPGSKDTLRGLAATYYMDPVQLVEDNAEVPLAGGAKLAVNGGLYEVPAEVGAGTLQAIAARFGLSAAAVTAANPELNWSQAQPPWTLVNLPSLTATAGTSPGAGSFGEIAGYYGVRPARLALDNESVPGLFTAPLRVRGGPLVRQASGKPGTVTYGLTRTAAPAAQNGDAKSALERLYSLLSYRLPEGSKSFPATTPGPPLGPVTAPPAPGGDRMRPPQDDGIWRYQKAVPYAKLASAPKPDGTGPDPAKSPYLGIGGLLQLDLAWNDIFGNRGLTPLSNPALSPGAPLNRPPARALYTDPVIGLSEWPSVGTDYEIVAGGAGQADLKIELAFDPCTYLNEGELGCKPAPSGKEQLDPKTRAERDMAVYERIWFQLESAVGGGLAVAVETSLLPESPLSVETGPLKAFAAEIFAWLAARAEGNVKPAPTMAPIVLPLDLATVASRQPKQIFELTVAVKLSRPPELVDPDLRVEGTAAGNGSTIPPRRGEEDGSYTLTSFVKSFEQAMTVAGSWRMKLAAGVDRERAERAGAGAPLWVTRLGLAAGQPLRVATMDPDNLTTYAPRPIANEPRSEEVTLKEYESGKGLVGPGQPKSFAAVDLDQWTQQLLAAVDGVLSPDIATAIGLLDGYLGRQSTHLQALAKAKEKLAAALAGLVIPVLEATKGADPQAARELFKQQLLIQLASFYTTDAIVQLEVDVASQCTDPKTAVRLFGNLKQTQDEQPVTLSDPKITMVEDGGPPATLTFLLSTAAGHADLATAKASVTLDLAFEGTHIEHQVGYLPGIVGYQPSSWLSFLRAEESEPLNLALGKIEVPLVLRSFPTPPTMVEQTGTQTVPDRPGQLALEKTLGWNYGLDYAEPIHYLQDTVHLTLEFNHQGSTGAPGPDATGGDPFLPLAQFITSYPAVEADLERFFTTVQPGKIDSKTAEIADVALTTFTEMVEAVAAALLSGLSVNGVRPGALPAASYELAISEATALRNSRKNPKEQITTLQVTVADLEGFGKPILVEIPGCEAEPLKSDKAPPNAGHTYAYAYVDEETEDWLEAAKGEMIAPRLVSAPDLNILGLQSGWASASIKRNENAAPPFHYQTPPVFFASQVFPTNTYTQSAIDVAAIGASPPSPQQRTPEQHLQALFAALFAAAPEGEQTIQLECRYGYQLSKAKLDRIELPVYLLAPTTVTPKQDLVIPSGGCPAARTEGRLVCRLGGAIRTWWEANRPSETSGSFQFVVTVMSQLTSQPLIVLGNLELGAQWISWS